MMQGVCQEISVAQIRHSIHCEPTRSQLGCVENRLKPVVLSFSFTSGRAESLALVMDVRMVDLTIDYVIRLMHLFARYLSYLSQGAQAHLPRPAGWYLVIPYLVGGHLHLSSQETLPRTSIPLQSVPSDIPSCICHYCSVPRLPIACRPFYFDNRE